MIGILLMIVGVIFALIGFFILLALMFEPVYSMYMVIFRRKDDYVYYETKPGTALLQRNKKSLRGSGFFFLIVGILFIVAGWFIKFGPRGTDSLFSKQVESGTGKGDAEVQNILRESINDAGNFVDANGGEHYGYVIVTGETVTYRDEFKGNIEEFEGFVKQMNGKQELYLVDEFASAKTYREVERILNDYGMNFEYGDEK